jgi:MFS family permease
MKKIPKTVIVLGWASLFTDIAGEGIASILPLFISQVLGAGVFAVGVIEGVADSTSSILKVFSGIWSDRVKQRKPLILWGYGLTGFIRPLIALASTWPLILVFRFIDRVGKGIRSSPRDALISDVSSVSNRGLSFGFHQAMDHAGQLVGPFLVGLLLLPFIGLSLKTVIFLSVIPGLAAFLTLLFGVRENKTGPAGNTAALDFKKDWNKLGGRFRKLLPVLLIFTLGNSTDAFLLLRLSQLGVASGIVAILWGGLGGVKMLSALWGGWLTDKIGRKPVIVMGWMYYALIYLFFAFVTHPSGFIVLFLIYGIYYGLCEPSEKAFVADLAPRDLRGTAFGYYNLVIGLGALPASLIFGLVGQRWGYPSAFMLGAALAGAASLLLLFLVRPQPSRS